MPHHYEDFLIYKGEHYSIYFHAETKDSSSVNDYYKSCDDAIRASFLYLVKRMCDIGHIYDETKFRIENRKNKIYCFKPKVERFFCFFFTGKKIIITSAYAKKRQNLDRNELDRAIKIRKEYLGK